MWQQELLQALSECGNRNFFRLCLSGATGQLVSGDVSECGNRTACFSRSVGEIHCADLWVRYTV